MDNLSIGKICSSCFKQDQLSLFVVQRRPRPIKIPSQNLSGM